MNALLWAGVILVLLWLFGWMFFEAVGFIIHVLLIAAVVIFVLWLLRRSRSPAP
ncbi:MAG: DUF5670 family protein [Longimicrobiales bacterium]